MEERPSQKGIAPAFLSGFVHSSLWPDFQLLPSFLSSRFTFPPPADSICLSWHSLKIPKFGPCFFIWLCVISDNYLTSLSLFYHLYKERIESHLELLIYSSQGDIHTLAHCAGQCLSLQGCTHPSTPPPCHLANIKTQLTSFFFFFSSNILRQVSPTSTHTAHKIFVCPLCFDYLLRMNRTRETDLGTCRGHSSHPKP